MQSTSINKFHFQRVLFVKQKNFIVKINTLRGQYKVLTWRALNTLMPMHVLLGSYLPLIHEVQRHFPGISVLGYQDANKLAVRFRNFGKVPYLSKVTLNLNDI